MKKMIFGLVALVCAWSGFAAEEVNKGLSETKQQPLKFRVNQETGAIEDAPGSDLIQKFLSAVDDVNVRYGSIKQTVEEQVKELDEALKDMSQGSIERFGAEIHRKKLETKLNKLENQRRELVDCAAPLLQEILKSIYNSLPADRSCHSNSYFFCCAIPDYEALTKQPLKDFVMDFSFKPGNYHWNEKSEEEKKITEKGFIFLKSKYNCFDDGQGNFSYHRQERLMRYFDHPQFSWKLTDLRKAIFERGTLIYSVATHQTDQLDPDQRLMLNSVVSMAERENRNVLEILREQIDASISKADNILVPKLAPRYRMARVIMAFQEEAPRHRPQKAEVPATGGSS